MTLFDTAAFISWIALCFAFGRWIEWLQTTPHLYRSRCNCGWHSSWWRAQGPPIWAWWIHAFVGWICGESVDGSVEEK